MRKWLWIGPGILYAIFFYWYTDFRGPMTPAEIDTIAEHLTRAGNSPAAITRVREFLASDTGRQMIMINALDMNESPPSLPATGPGAGPTDLLDHYMGHMYPAMFARASHPIFGGRAIADAMDLTGIEGAEHWEQGGLFRYRSRRDLMEISTDPRFAERHDYKIAALTKTIAYPVEGTIYYHDLRFLLALILFSLASALDLALFRRN